MLAQKATIQNRSHPNLSLAVSDLALPQAVRLLPKIKMMTTKGERKSSA
jgi:hypothetical protein